MENLNERTSMYFETRTKGKQGVIRDLVYTKYQNHTIFLCDNDYLNLVNHKDVIEAQVKDLESSSNRGTVMSAILLGDEELHTRLEADMGQWFGKDCMLAQSGYAANVGLMHAIVEPGMPIYADVFLHMSFYDGVASRRGQFYFNKHNDTAHLEENIIKHGPGIILIESLYSAHGTFSPLEDIVKIKQRYGCILVVDESHSLGVFSSKGYVHLKGLQNDVDFVTASLAKSYATRAGVVFAPNGLFVKENAFTYIFSSALMRNDIVRIRAIWEIIQKADDRRQRLLEMSHLLRREVSKVARTIEVRGSMPSPIICLRMKDEDEMSRLYQHLSSRGILVSPFCAPATAVNHPILRLTVSSIISEEDIYRVVESVSEFYGTQGSMTARL